MAENRSQGRPKARRGGLALTGVGIEFAAAVAGLTLVGVWIDRHYGSGPWGVLIGAAIGIVGGTYNAVRAALRAGRDIEAERTGDGRDAPGGGRP